MPQTLNADYKVIVLSGNAFLWLGLKTFISQSVDPCPEIFWINDVSPEGILPLRQLMLNIRVKKGWLVFTDASRVNDIKIILGGGACPRGGGKPVTRATQPLFSEHAVRKRKKRHAHLPGASGLHAVPQRVQPGSHRADPE